MSKSKVRLHAYASPGCVYLAFDWPDGGRHEDFLGFAIERDPGFGRNGKPQYLLNKLDFTPIQPNDKPKPSDEAPFQKFNWWDGGINPKDRGKTFMYTATPVCGSGPADLTLQNDASRSISVTIPDVREGQIATYFNRAVVSAQSFERLKRSGATLEQQMDWLANGIQDAIPAVLDGASSFNCAIYHLTDERWVLPALENFQGAGSIVYYDRSSPKSKVDHATRDGLKRADLNDRISERPRTHIKSLMHDKFIVRYENGHDKAVLMGSANFTPEAFTVQANLLHIVYSPQLADLYDIRFRLLKSDPTMANVTKLAEWVTVNDVPGTTIRVFFSPEAKGERVSLDTITKAVNGATSSVLFCVFSPTDQKLLNAILAAGDNNRILYGLVNAIPDPTKKPKKGKKKRTPSTISVEIYHRSRTDRKVLQYDLFSPANAPRGFLPEESTIDTREYSGGKSAPFAVHIHHKFVVIDGDTDSPTIYTGSPNLSTSSTNSNDENLLEFKDNTHLARLYVAEFMRVYNHYRTAPFGINYILAKTKAASPCRRLRQTTRIRSCLRRNDPTGTTAPTRRVLQPT